MATAGDDMNLAADAAGVGLVDMLAHPFIRHALLAGTGFRCVGILEALEQDLKRPVISANQASLWHCLRSAGVQTNIPGYGNLLRM